MVVLGRETKDAWSRSASWQVVCSPRHEPTKGFKNFVNIQWRERAGGGRIPCRRKTVSPLVAVPTYRACQTAQNAANTRNGGGASWDTHSVVANDTLVIAGSAGLFSSETFSANNSRTSLTTDSLFLVSSGSFTATGGRLGVSDVLNFSGVGGCLLCTETASNKTISANNLRTSLATDSLFLVSSGSFTAT